MNQLKVTSGMNPKTTKVLVDGVPIANATSLSVKLSIDDVPRVKVEYFVHETDIELTGMFELFTVVNGVRYKLVAEE